MPCILRWTHVVGVQEANVVSPLSTFACFNHAYRCEISGRDLCRFANLISLTDRSWRIVFSLSQLTLSSSERESSRQKISKGMARITEYGLLHTIASYALYDQK